MKVAINLLQLPPGRVEGVVTYAKKLVENLPPYFKDGELILLRQPGLDLGELDPKITVLELDPPSFMARAINKLMTMGHLRVTSSHARQLTKTLAKHNVDMVHYLLSTIPATDFSFKVPFVLTFHDMQHEFQPENFSANELIQRRGAFKPSTERADKIIAISNDVARSLTQKFKTPSKKITVIYEAGDISKTPKEVSNLPKEYMFYPAADWKHKNHVRLLEAVAKLNKDGFEAQLVLTGFRSERAAVIQKSINELGIEHLVTDLGPVTSDELAYVYRHAKMLICPSRFEGFGLPPLEAMSIGVPVACSNTTSLPEIVGDAAETFNPDSIDEIVASISKVWNDKTYRAKLIAAGKKQAAKFSWQRMAEETHKVYESIDVGRYGMGKVK